VNGDSWVLDGSKIFITLRLRGPVSRSCSLGAGGDGARGITCFPRADVVGGVPRRGRSTASSASARQDTAEIVLEGRARPGLGSARRRRRRFSRSAIGRRSTKRPDLSRGRLGRHCAGLRGMHRSPMRGERRQFGKPIAAFQLVAGADRGYGGREPKPPACSRGRAASLADTGQAVHARCVAGRSTTASEVAVRAANAAVQVHGGYGLCRRVSRYRNTSATARVSTLYEGTSQIQKLLIGARADGRGAPSSDLPDMSRCQTPGTLSAMSVVSAASGFPAVVGYPGGAMSWCQTPTNT